MSEELYKKHRPKNLKQIHGQADGLKSINAMAKAGSIPHSMLFTGPSGCGKTTLARILVKKLKCGKTDFIELNAAQHKGIDMVRRLQQRANLAPTSGKCRIWIIDECHEMTKPAQDAFLKLLEDTPKHVYFFLATTDPQKLKPTIRTRCTEIKVKDLSQTAMTTLLEQVLDKEEVELGEEVIEKLIEHAEGSARKCLVLLHQIINIEDEEDQLNAIENSDSKAQAIVLARLLMNPGVKWADVGKVLKELDDDPEGLRRMVLGYANAICTGSSKLVPRAYIVIDAFRDNFFDSGKAGLTAACYEVVNGES